MVCRAENRAWSWRVEISTRTRFRGRRWESAGGVKCGGQMVFAGRAQADTAANATAMASVVQFIVSMAQLQAQQKNPQLATLLPSISVTTSANLVNLSLNVPESQAEQIVK